jgi:alpha/beta superfamily hydrolase
VRDWVESVALHPCYVELPGVGHFFHGRLNELRDVVTAFVENQLVEKQKGPGA